MRACKSDGACLVSIVGEVAVPSYMSVPHFDSLIRCGNALSILKSYFVSTKCIFGSIVVLRQRAPINCFT